MEREDFNADTTEDDDSEGIPSLANLLSKSQISMSRDRDQTIKSAPLKMISSSSVSERLQQKRKALQLKPMSKLI